MLKKMMCWQSLLGLLCIMCYTNADAAVAPVTLTGDHMIMSYYHATGQLAKKVGDSYYANLKEHTFFSAMLTGKRPHKGYYSYRRVNPDEGIITVEHPTGRFKGWSYSMTLHFAKADLGTFDIVDHGKINGTMDGVFMLSKHA